MRMAHALWESDSTEILINPKIPELQQCELRSQLNTLELRGHFWLATSGSSSTSNVSPKWAALSKNAVLHSALAVNKHLDATSRDRWALTLPPFHVGGLGILARAFLSGCEVIHCQPKWDPEAFHRCCCEGGASLTALVPTQLYDLVQKRLDAPPSLRAAIIGGGGLSSYLYGEAKKLGWNPLPSYGLTECASQVATASLDSLQRGENPELTLLPHIEEVSQNSEGCLKLRSSSLLTAYALSSDGKIFRHDPKVEGWFETEDVVLLKGNSIIVEGRKTAIVKVGGENVNIEQLNFFFESLSLAKPIEGDRALVAIPSERLGHEVHLADANTPRHELNHLVEQYNSQVLPFERIRKVHHLDKIPRTPLNKVKVSSLLQSLM